MRTYFRKALEVCATLANIAAVFTLAAVFVALPVFWGGCVLAGTLWVAVTFLRILL